MGKKGNIVIFMASWNERVKKQKNHLHDAMRPCQNHPLTSAMLPSFLLLPPNNQTSDWT